MYENIKMVVADLDETVVVTHKTITPRNKAAIDKLREHGILFGVASGRSISDLKYIVGTWGVEADLICALNGSDLFDGTNGQVYKYYQLEPEWIKETFDIMRPFETNPVIYLDWGYLVGRYDKSVHFSTQFTKADYKVADCEEDFYREPNAKMMFRVNPNIMPEVEKRVAEFESPFYKGNKTRSDLMEFQHRNASKAYGIEQYAKLHGFTMENVMAFGDTTNDNEMIAQSGIGVAMINGSADTKALADMITFLPVGEDGFADFLEKTIFAERGW